VAILNEIFYKPILRNVLLILHVHHSSILWTNDAGCCVVRSNTNETIKRRSPTDVDAARSRRCYQPVPYRSCKYACAHSPKTILQSWSQV